MGAKVVPGGHLLRPVGPAARWAAVLATLLGSTPSGATPPGIGFPAWGLDPSLQSGGFTTIRPRDPDPASLSGQAAIAPWMCRAIGNGPGRDAWVETMLDLAHEAEFCAPTANGGDGENPVVPARCEAPLQKPPRGLPVRFFVDPDATAEARTQIADGFRRVSADLARVAGIRLVDELGVFDGPARAAPRTPPREGVIMVVASEKRLRSATGSVLLELSSVRERFLAAAPADVPCTVYLPARQEAPGDPFVLVAVLRLEAGPEKLAACISEELINGMGLLQDPPGLDSLLKDRWTQVGAADVPQDWRDFGSGLPLRYALALRILSDDAFAPGQARAETQAEVHELLARACGP